MPDLAEVESGSRQFEILFLLGTHVSDELYHLVQYQKLYKSIHVPIS